MLSSSHSTFSHDVVTTPPARWPTAFATEEITRIREHLLGAIVAVGSRSTEDLAPAQRSHRTLLLGELIRYAVAGRFPKNIEPGTDMRPTFVDHEGTRCAMARLIEHTGERALVDRVSSTANHAYVRELAVDPVLVEWLIGNGLSADEAARIQPGYCGSPAVDCVCELTFVDAADLIAGVVQADGRLLVDEVYKSATGIAVGDVLEVTANLGAFAEGERVFADYADGAQLYYSFVDEGTLSMSTCTPFQGVQPATLELSVVLDIVDGAECIQTLQAADPNWVDEGECNNEGVGGGGEGQGGDGQGGGAAVEDGGSSSGGCSFASLPSHESGLLLALVAGLAIARSRRVVRQH